MKKYQLIVTVGVIAIVGFTAVRAEWTDPQVVPVGGGRDIPVNSSIFSQIKSQGLGVAHFYAAGNAQFDQAVFASGMIRGGTPVINPTTPTTVSFGGPNNEVGIEANGTFYVRDEITTPSLANTESKQVCADQYGFLSLCQ